METSLKTGLAQIFSCCPKNLSCQNLGGSPPGPYAYEFSFNANQWQSIKFATTFQVSSVWLSIVHRLAYPSRCQLTESNRVLWIDRSIFLPSISSTVQALQPLHISSEHTPQGRRTPIWKVGGWMCLDWNRPIRTWLNLCLTQIISF